VPVGAANLVPVGGYLLAAHIFRTHFSLTRTHFSLSFIKRTTRIFNLKNRFNGKKYCPRLFKGKNKKISLIKNKCKINKTKGK